MTSLEPPRAARVLVFDSGLGGLTVLERVREIRPDVDIVYAADDALFPYGALAEDVLISRVSLVVGELIAAQAPDLVVIACNTASTLVLPPLRAAFPHLPFVGTVPAIKPAAEASRSRMISVLATPGTVARDYTRALIRDFADDCEVELVGSPRLAALAERRLHGEGIEDADIAREFAPCFQEHDGRRTDHIVLACTHFPLLTDRLEALSPWPVKFIDPAPAIARRVDALLGPARAHTRQSISPAIFTSGETPPPTLRKALLDRGLAISSTLQRRAS